MASLGVGRWRKELLSALLYTLALFLFYFRPSSFSFHTDSSKDGVVSVSRAAEEAGIDGSDDGPLPRFFCGKYKDTPVRLSIYKNKIFFSLATPIERISIYIKKSESQ